MTWDGHHRTTRLALQGIFERARWGKGTASTEERVLANVCELRRAAANGEWLERLRTDCLADLAAARFALNEIGAMSVAAYFSEAMTALRRSCSRRQRRAALLKLERDLSAAGPRLDVLIAKYAAALLEAASRKVSEGTESRPPSSPAA